MSLNESFSFDDVESKLDINHIEYILNNASGAANRPEAVLSGLICEAYFGIHHPNVFQLSDTDPNRYYYDFASTVDTKVYEIKTINKSRWKTKTNSNQKYVEYQRLFQLDEYLNNRLRYDGLKPRFVFFTSSDPDPFKSVFSCVAIVPFCEMVMVTSRCKRGFYSEIPHNRLNLIGE